MDGSPPVATATTDKASETPKLSSEPTSLSTPAKRKRVPSEHGDGVPSASNTITQEGFEQKLKELLQLLSKYVFTVVLYISNYCYL